LPALASLLVFGGVDLLQVSVGQPVQKTVNLQAAVPDGVDHSRNAPEVIHALLNVQLGECVLLVFRAERVQGLGVLLADLAHGLEPDVEDIELVVGERGLDTSAGSVAAQDNVLDLEVLDAELDGGQQSDVGRVDNVGDVAQDEDLTGLLAQDSGLGDTRVAAADPQDVGRLALGAVLEELGVFGGDILGPNLVGLEGGVQSVVWRNGGVSWSFLARGLSSRRCAQD